MAGNGGGVGNGDAWWQVKLASRKKCLAVKPVNVRRPAAAGAPALPAGLMGGLPPAAAEAITPEMMSMVQSMLMKPGGVQEMLAHPAVQKLKGDPAMKPFFADLETQGMFGALAYLSNQEVMGKIAVVAKEIQGR